MSLARLGYRVGVLDADFGLGNIDVLLGLTPDGHIGHVLAGEKTLAEIVVDAARTASQIIPASSGLQSLTALDRRRSATALRDGARRSPRRDLDFLLIDTAAGISDNVDGHAASWPSASCSSPRSSRRRSSMPTPRPRC